MDPSPRGGKHTSFSKTIRVCRKDVGALDGARKALQRALAIDPYSRMGKSLLAKVEKECSRNAQINFKKATVFADLNNNTDAKSACQLAMSYHNRKTDKFNRKCRDLLKTIERRLEGIR